MTLGHNNGQQQQLPPPAQQDVERPPRRRDAEVAPRPDPPAGAGDPPRVEAPKKVKPTEAEARAAGSQEGLMNFLNTIAEIQRNNNNMVTLRMLSLHL